MSRRQRRGERKIELMLIAIRRTRHAEHHTVEKKGSFIKSFVSTSVLEKECQGFDTLFWEFNVLKLDYSCKCNR